MMSRSILLFVLLLAGCGGYAGPTTGDIAPKPLASLTRDEMARLHPKASACVADGAFWPADPTQRLLTGPGFEECPAIIAVLKAEYLREEAAAEAEIKTQEAKAEADDLARRRAIIQGAGNP